MSVFVSNIGDTEKITINGEKVRDKMSLFGYEDTLIIEKSGEVFPCPEGYSYGGELPNGDRLFIKIVTTSVNNLVSSIEGISGNIIIHKPNGQQLSIEIPSYDIPQRSLTGNGYESKYTYSYQYNSFEESLYFKFKREVTNNNTSGGVYWSIYKLNIEDDKMDWEEKVIELCLYKGDQYTWRLSLYSSYCENNYIYLVYNDANGKTQFAGYEFVEEQTIFSPTLITTITNSSIYYSSHCFLTKRNNEYIFLYAAGSVDIVNTWVSIIRNLDNSYTISQGYLRLPESNNGTDFNFIQLNNEFYIMELQGYEYDEIYEDNGFLNFYKLNEDKTQWENVLSLSEKASVVSTKINYYINGQPKHVAIGWGIDDTSNPDGTKYPAVSKDNFDFYIFNPQSLSYTKYNRTPKKLSLSSFVNFFEDNEHIFFYFRPWDSSSTSSRIYETMTIERQDGRPVLYSSYQVKV